MFTEEIGGECKACGYNMLLQRFNPSPVYPKFEACARCGYAEMQINHGIALDRGAWELIFLIDGQTIGLTRELILEYLTSIEPFNTINQLTHKNVFEDDN